MFKRTLSRVAALFASCAFISHRNEGKTAALELAVRPDPQPKKVPPPTALDGFTTSSLGYYGAAPVRPVWGPYEYGCYARKPSQRQRRRAWRRQQLWPA